MRTSLFALSLVASLVPFPALAQQPPSSGGYDPHHPQTVQEAIQPPQDQGMGAMPMGQGTGAMPQGMGAMPMMGQGMMGMMSCPMMQGGMAAMMGRPGMGAPRGDESVPSLAFRAVTEKMHRDMAITLTGNADADFVRSMIAHHQGAIDMARIELAFGKDAQIRQLAEGIIRTQEAEITTMRDWLAKQPK